MTRAELLALAARVEAAQGGDCELNMQIARSLLPKDAEHVTRTRLRGWSYRVFGLSGWDEERVETKPYTSSLDAAASLVPSGWAWGVDRLHRLDGSAFGRAMAHSPRGFEHDVTDVEAATPALALTAAALRAMAEEAPDAE